MHPERDALIPLNALEDDPSVRHRFTLPQDLRVMALGVVGISILATLFGITIEVDQVVQAQGVLDSHNRLFEVRSPHAGQLNQVLVETGDAVQAGTLLAELDTQPIQHQLTLLRAEQRQLEHDLWSHFYALEPLLDLFEVQQMLAQLDPIPERLASTTKPMQLRQQIQLQLQTLRSEQHTLSARIAAQHVQIEGAEAAVLMARQEAFRYQSLVQHHLESPAQLASLEHTFLQHQRHWDQLRAELPIHQAQWQQLEAQVQHQQLVFELAHRQQFQSTQVQLERNRLMQQQQLTEQAQYQLRAPAAGTIDQVLWHGAGEVIQSGQTMAIMRPEFASADLWVALEVAASDIVWLEPGLPFRATVKGRSGEDHGVVHGTLGFISSSTTQSETEPKRYRIQGHIEYFEPSHRRPNPDQLWRPGLPLEATIQAGERRLLHYLLDPFRQTLHLAWREPS